MITQFNCPIYEKAVIIYNIGYENKITFQGNKGITHIIF